MPKRKRLAPKKHRNNLDDDHDDVNEEIFTSLDGEKAVSQIKKAKKTHVETVTFKSAGRFSLTEMVIQEGLFQGYKAILMKPEPVSSDLPSMFLGLPAEIRNLIYVELFSSKDEEVMVQHQKRNGKVRTYMPEVRNGRSSPAMVTPSAVTSIFSVNRQIRRETTSIFFSMKTFVAPSPRKMKELLPDLHAAVNMVRKIRITGSRSSGFGQLFFSLQDATGLEAITLCSSYLARAPGANHRQRTGWRSISASGLCRMILPLFRILLTARLKASEEADSTSEVSEMTTRLETSDKVTSAMNSNSKVATSEDASPEAVANILQFNTMNEWCSCRGRDPHTGVYHCQEARAEVEEAARDLREEMKVELEKFMTTRKEQIAKDQAKKVQAAAEELRKIEELDDYSYLEDMTTIERKDTGRPKRHATRKSTYQE
ncbi:Hypothetical protein D9617_18g034150 [Elsinoe fawcettii]|nr:Hypothetical protein D9617_18g034150 [Elsinoe fawcettii]